MPIDAQIPLMVQPPQQVSPLDSLARVLSIKNEMAKAPLIQGQQQLQQQAVQEGAIRLKNAQAVQDAFASANQKNPDGTTSFNMDNLKTALYGTPGGIEALTHITQFEKGQADLQEAQGKVDLLHRNNGGSIAAAVEPLIATDPLAASHLFLTMGGNAVANKAADPKAWAPFQQAVQAALQQDPTGQSAAPILKQITGMLKQNSPEQQKLATEAQTAQGAAQRGQAAADQAATAAKRETAAEEDRGYMQAVGQFAAAPPPTKEAYATAVDQLPKGVADRILRAVPVEQYDPAKSPGVLNQSAMTPEQRFNANKPPPSRTVSVEQQAVNTAAEVVAKKLGIQLDPLKPWQSQIPIERQPSVFALSKQMMQDPAVRAGVEEARNNARSDKSYQFNVRELDQIGKPVAELTQRLGRLQDTLAQNSPQADALVGPELLTVMAGGAGSGLRMNEAEIARIVGGRSKWEDLKAAINKWKLDPSKANSITQDQRNQIHSLMQTVATKVQAKQQVIDQANQELLQSDDPNAHRKAVYNARKGLSSIDQQAGAAGTQSGTVKMKAPDGTISPVPADQLDHYKKLGATVVP